MRENTIDRSRYIESRAKGGTMTASALLAGAASGAYGSKIEAEYGVKELIETRRKEIAIELHCDWEKSVKALAKIRDSKKSTNMEKIAAIKLFAKIGGHLAPKKVELNQRVMVAALDRDAMDKLMANPDTLELASRLVEAHAGLEVKATVIENGHTSNGHGSNGSE